MFQLSDSKLWTVTVRYCIRETIRDSQILYKRNDSCLTRRDYERCGMHVS